MLRTAVAFALLLAVTGAAAAQEQPEEPAVYGPPDPRPTAEELMQAADEKLRRGAARRTPAPASANEIVVTAENPDDLRVPSDTDLGDPDDGVARAPDVSNPDLGKGVVVARGCFIPPCPRPMPPMIDLKAIPEAPPGSDAARYAEE